MAKAKKTISKEQFDEAAKRFAENTNKCAAIISKSELKIKAEMDKRHVQLGNMPDELKEDEAILIQYAEDNKLALFAESKTYDTGLGVVISFRVGNPKLTYGDGVKAEDLLAAIQKKNLVEYVATKHSLDARAIIASAEVDKSLRKIMEAVGASVEQEENINVKYKPA